MKDWFEVNKPKFAWAVVVLAIIVAMFMGVTYPIPPAPIETPQFKVQPTGALYPVAQDQIVVQTLVVRGTQVPLPTATAQPTYAYTAPTAIPYVLQYGTSSGKRVVCGSQNITGTGTIAHGLATPSYVQASLAGDVTGDAARVSSLKAGAVITLSVWGAQLTPVANTTPIAVDWCVFGTP